MTSPFSGFILVRFVSTVTTPADYLKYDGLMIAFPNSNMETMGEVADPARSKEAVAGHLFGIRGYPEDGGQLVGLTVVNYRMIGNLDPTIKDTITKLSSDTGWKDPAALTKYEEAAKTLVEYGVAADTVKAILSNLFTAAVTEKTTTVVVNPPK